jgi:hypothetical protein
LSERLGAEFRQSSKKGLGVRDAELDFDFGWHGGENSRNKVAGDEG